MLVGRGELAQAFEVVGRVDVPPAEDGAFAVDFAFEEGSCEVEVSRGLGHNNWRCGDAECSGEEGVDEE